MAVQITQQKELFEEMRRMDLMVIRRAISLGQLMAIQIQPTLLKKIREAQIGDLKLQEFRKQVEAGLRSDMQIHADGTLRFGNRICVSKGEVRQEVLVEAHSSTYSIHPGDEDVPRPEAMVLVAWDEKRDCSVCSKVPGVSTSEGRISEDGWTSSTSANSRMEVGPHHYRFCHCFTSQPEG